MALKILIAEDDKDLADSYRMILEQRGHEVTITSNGLDCQRTFKMHTRKAGGQITPYFDAVILDHKMMGMDGVETAKLIQEVLPQQKIIFITGYGGELLQKLPELSKTASVMNKPVSPQALVTEVEGFAVTKFREMTRNRQARR
ncbi:MAG: response regulator [Thaumarchaeota archaeon]|nr:response regulator [Nitrososphaerota archaeon]